MAAHALFYGEGIRATGVDRIIERSAVSKVTFYRQYASKDELVRAYLDDRHDKWLSWFRANLAQATGQGASAVDALVTTLRIWFSQPDFRGCAFLNAAAELGASDSDILATVRRHKEDVSSVLEETLGSLSKSTGRALTLAMDGAIVHAQMGYPIHGVLESFETVVARTLRD